MDSFTFLEDLLAETTSLPSDSILSRTLLQNKDLRVILFHFAPGQELSEHTSSKPAILHFLSGEATLTLGTETKQAHANSMAYMQPNLAHSIVAESEVRMLLIMLEKNS